MNAAHIHLILNHIPVIGLGFVGAFFVIALYLRHRAFQRVSLAFLVMLALITIPVYLSGEPAEEVVETVAGVSEAAIEAHEEAATVTFVAMEVLGALALLGLFLSRGQRVIPRAASAVLLLATAVGLGLAIWTANLGGKVHHPEIRGDAPPAAHRDSDDD